ncbi:MAG: glucosaminidase domain-containing protein [Rikenellaceae bacterium]
MNRICNLIVAFVCLCSIHGYAQQMTSEQYIAKYKTLAIESMIKYDIPASIKLAQGLVESASGNSRLATSANNHFGIKCKSHWQGETISHNDDAVGECFRKYASAQDSYIDHSEFLKGSERYDFLFNYDILDYESWAKGLSRAGYATNPKYPLLLIKAIEDYELYLVDDEALDLKDEYLAAKEKTSVEPETVKKTPEKIPAVIKSVPIEKTVPEAHSKESKKTKRKKEKVKKTKESGVSQILKTSSGSLTSVSIPVKANISSSTTSSSSSSSKGGFMSKSIFNSGSVVELYNRLYDGPKFDVNGYVLVKTSPRKVYKSNNVLFVIAKDNDTFETIGNSLNMSAVRILGYNDIAKESNIRITEGSVVYISVKGSKSKNGYSIHTVKKGDTIHSVSQIYGVKMANLIKINGYSENYELTPGQRVKLK